ncbi:MAG: HD-GYP domain-containing protein [Chloroflexi bacterium]|nr:HD-GYP domain-containing protein [Chloroflexota bacterium]
MSKLPWKARTYIFLLTALMASAVFISILLIGSNFTLWIVSLGAAGVIAALDHFSVRQFGVQIEVSVSNAIKFATVLLFPTPVVVISIFGGTVLGEVFLHRAWFKKIFNVSAMTLTWVITGWVYSSLSTPSGDYFGSFINVFALIMSSLTAYVINTSLVCLVISFAARLPFLYVLKQNSKVSAWHEASLFTLGLFLAVLWRFNPLSVALAALPLLVVRNSYQTANYLRNQTQDALRALVRVVDERDHHTLNHSELVSQYSRMVAENLDLPQEDIETIASAALLHDLGKVGMADDILFGTKGLTLEQRKSAEDHAQVGAMLLSKFPLFDRGSILVRHHHEHFDGNGYPDGLQGELIPLGSRIISVADAYQAMTENRTYRPALTPEQAIARLKEASGAQFDPQIVETFIQALARTSTDPTPLATPASSSTSLAESQST